MKKFSKLQIFAWCLSVIPLLLVSFLYARLPARVPMSWGFDGVVRYDEKWQLFIVALLPIVFAVLFPILPRLDPKKKNYTKFQGSYDLFQVLMMLFLLILVSVCLTEALRPGTINVIMFVCLTCGLLFTFLGNMMPKFRSNWFCGIRTPWTMSSDIIWQKTNLLGGRLFFAAGLVAMVSAFIPNDIIQIVLVLVPTILAAMVPALFSYLWYRQGNHNA